MWKIHDDPERKNNPLGWSVGSAVLVHPVRGLASAAARREVSV